MVMVSNQSGMEVGRLAGRFPGRIGHLYSPGGQRGPWPWMPYALDNGAWGAFKRGTAFDDDAWHTLLRWAIAQTVRPLWASVPDKVEDAGMTKCMWYALRHYVTCLGIRPAMVVQDGMTTDDVVDREAVVFIGGSTDWKLRSLRAWCSAFPGRVHVGRVNTWKRLMYCYEAGAVSVDGTGWFYDGQRELLERFLEETSACSNRENIHDGSRAPANGGGAGESSMSPAAWASLCDDGGPERNDRRGRHGGGVRRNGQDHQADLEGVGPSRHEHPQCEMFDF